MASNRVILSRLRSARARAWAVLIAAIDAIVLCLVRRGSGGGILLVRLDAIGDFVLWSDAARTLGAYHSKLGRNVTLLANMAWAEWAREFEIANRVWSLDTHRFERDLIYRWGWLKRIRNAGFDLAVEPCHSRRFLLGDSLIRATGACERVGSQGDLSNIRPTLKRWSDCWYTRLVASTNGELMELRRNAEFMRGAGFGGFVARIPAIPEAAISYPRRTPDGPYVVLFPGASSEGRVWPLDRVAELGRRIMERGIAIVVAGGPADASHATRLEELGVRFINLVGRTSLSQLAGLLRGAALVVTNETSAAHIGAAVGTPTVCILGGGHFGRFMPHDVEVSDVSRPLPRTVHLAMPCFGCNWQCKFPREVDGAMKCVHDISVEAVWKEVGDLIESVQSCSQVP